jgi:hypothetical protein
MSLIQAYKNGFIHKDSITKTYSFVVKGKVVGRGYESISDLITAQQKPVVTSRRKTSKKAKKGSVVDSTHSPTEQTPPEQTEDQVEETAG